MILEKLYNGFSKIEKMLNESDHKAMLKARGNLIPGTNEANEKEVLAMLENQKKTWYMELKQVSLDITYCRSVIDHIFELKNRKTDEIFRLRAENAKLRTLINQSNEK